MVHAAFSADDWYPEADQSDRAKGNVNDDQSMEQGQDHGASLWDQWRQTDWTYLRT